jgi:hypothetical protein
LEVKAGSRRPDELVLLGDGRWKTWTRSEKLKAGRA